MAWFWFIMFWMTFLLGAVLFGFYDRHLFPWKRRPWYMIFFWPRIAIDILLDD